MNGQRINRQIIKNESNQLHHQQNKAGTTTTPRQIAQILQNATEFVRKGV